MFYLELVSNTFIVPISLDSYSSFYIASYIQTIWYCKVRIKSPNLMIPAFLIKKINFTKTSYACYFIYQTQIEALF